VINGWELDLLRFVDEADLTLEHLFVRRNGDGIRWVVDCSDFFDWGSADGEEIKGQADVDLLRQVAVDLAAAERCAEVYAFDLWCCRKRRRQPMSLWRKAQKIDDGSVVAALFAACDLPRPSA
jgi:hypothetical protein